MSNSRNVLKVLVVIFALVMKIPPIIKWFMEGWADIYASRQQRQLAMMLLQRLPKPGCLSNEHGSCTRGPVACRAPRGAGPGSRTAASHFPASLYGWVVWGEPSTRVWRRACFHTSAQQQSRPSPYHGPPPIAGAMLALTVTLPSELLFLVRRMV